MCYVNAWYAREGIFRYRTLEYDELGYVLFNSF